MVPPWLTVNWLQRLSLLAYSLGTPARHPTISHLLQSKLLTSFELL
jgi:hypothetical protein